MKKMEPRPLFEEFGPLYKELKSLQEESKLLFVQRDLAVKNYSTAKLKYEATRCKERELIKNNFGEYINQKEILDKQRDEMSKAPRRINRKNQQTKRESL